MTERGRVLSVTLAMLGALWGTQILARQAQQTSGGNATLYIGAWPNRIFVIDEATEKITDEIPLQVRTTAPGTLEMSGSRTRFYVRNVNLEDIEVVDIAAKKSIDLFRLSEGRRRVRIRSLAADPLDRFVVLLAKPSEKLTDHYAIGPTTLLVYDLGQHRVTRTVPWPDNEEREAANMLFSPDGKFLYLFGQDVVIYDTSTFQPVDKWELAQPYEPGAGRFNVGRIDAFQYDPGYDERGYYTNLFRVTDPIQNRPLMGIGRVNLQAKSFEFTPIGPAQDVSFTMAPDRQRGYGLYQAIGRYEFWAFDLPGRKLLNRVEFAGRPRMSLKTSSNGRLLYVYNAGNTIDVYDAATYNHLRTITFDGDTTTPLRILTRQ